MPPLTPKKLTLGNGIKVELFYINEIAFSLGRTPQTVRKWEISGVIPKTPFKDSSGRRMYTRDQINAIVEIAENCNIKQGLTIANTSFSSKVHKAFEELNKKYGIGVAKK